MCMHAYMLVYASVHTGTQACIDRSLPCMYIEAYHAYIDTCAARTDRLGNIVGLCAMRVYAVVHAYAYVYVYIDEHTYLRAQAVHAPAACVCVCVAHA